MTNEKWYLGLDVGSKHIGVAVGDNLTKIPVALGTILMLLDDKAAIGQIAELVKKYNVEKIVVGLPRNSSGEETKQSDFSRDFASKLEVLKIPIVFQDESLTSVEAENRLLEQNLDFNKLDIDAESARIILSDFLESQDV